jgi:hypothetical protein
MGERVGTTWDIAAPTGNVVNACRVLLRSLMEIDRLDDLDVDGTAILCYNIVMDPEGTDSVSVK